MESLNTCTVGIVAPAWLIEPLAVLLQAAAGTELWAHATTGEALLSAPVDGSPDLVILYASGRHTASQVEEIKAAWPNIRSIVVVEHSRYQSAAEEAGADVVLLEGLAPGRLLKTLDSLRVGSDHDPSGDQMP